MPHQCERELFFVTPKASIKEVTTFRRQQIVQLIDLISFFSFWARDLWICGRSSQEITHETTGFAAALCHPGIGSKPKHPEDTESETENARLKWIVEDACFLTEIF